MLVTLASTSQKNLLGTGFRAALDSLASSNLIRNYVTVRVVGFPQVMACFPGILLVRVYAGEFIRYDNTVGGSRRTRHHRDELREKSAIAY